MTRVLLIEDDASLGRTLAERLEREQVSVNWVRTVAEARTALAAESWNLAIVDVTLPDGSGFGLARLIRKGTTTPIMFMTALNSAESRLEGFEIGAEEYLPKPFHLKEFIIRVRLLLARQRPPDPLKVGGFRLDFDAMSVESPDGEKVFLQVRDNRVLKLLVDAAPRVVNRSEILDRVWGEDHFPTPRAVDNAIVRLRQALKDEDGQIIRSVRGIGYQWAGSSEA
ncbi:MAG TPA: response regulator transcription factor [Vicinamibacterales bacterium]|nr:response regulator transcription factor [Vicinamibacterales bacterium]